MWPADFHQLEQQQPRQTSRIQQANPIRKTRERERSPNMVVMPPSTRLSSQSIVSQHVPLTAAAQQIHPNGRLLLGRLENPHDLCHLHLKGNKIRLVQCVYAGRTSLVEEKNQTSKRRVFLSLSLCFYDSLVWSPHVAPYWRANGPLT